MLRSNIFPDLDAKRDIIQNAIDLFTQIGLGIAACCDSLHLSKRSPLRYHRRSTRLPSARWPTAGKSLERSLTVHSRLTTQSTPEAARIKGIHSPVAGRGHRSWSCRISKTGNMLAKNLVYLSKADSAGPGTPVRGCRSMLTSHMPETPFAAAWASCAAAVLYAAARRKSASITTA